MLDFPRWKIAGIVGLLLIGILLAVPSFVPERLMPFRAPRINLGLDLSGGSHLLLEADATSLQKQRLEQMEETIRTEMRRADPKIEIGDISSTGGQLSFFVRDVTKVDQAVEQARKQTTGIGVTGQRDWDVRVVDTNRIVMAPTEAGKNDAVAKA